MLFFFEVLVATVHSTLRSNIGFCHSHHFTLCRSVSASQELTMGALPSPPIIFLRACRARTSVDMLRSGSACSQLQVQASEVTDARLHKTQKHFAATEGHDTGGGE
jgi:hypothetical protein